VDDELDDVLLDEVLLLGGEASLLCGLDDLHRTKEYFN
jgi:hypothetical protein